MSPRQPTLPTPPLQLRGRAPELVPFATAAWMHGGHHCENLRGIPHKVYAHHHHATIERLWNDPEVTWLFAAHAPDPNFVFGYLIGEATNQGPVLHWLYVRRSMRRMGIARALLEAFLTGQQRPAQRDGLPHAFHTLSNAEWRALLVAKPEVVRGWDWLYDPWLLDQQPFVRV